MLDTTILRSRESTILKSIAGWLKEALFTPWFVCFFSLAYLLTAFWSPYLKLLKAGPVKFLPWDSGWYKIIATEGYVFNGNYKIESNIAFFPIYPYLSKFVSILTGLTIDVSLYAVSTISAFISIFFIFKIAERVVGKKVAFFAVLLFIANPLAFYLVTGHTESVFLLFVSSSLYFTIQKRFIIAALLAGLATGVRHTGVLLSATVMLAYALDTFKSKSQPLFSPKFLSRAIGLGVLSVLGLASYMTYLFVRFGDPLAFYHAQQAWYGDYPPGSFSLRKFFLLTNLITDFRSRWDYPEFWDAIYRFRSDGIWYACLQLLALPIAFAIAIFILPTPLWCFMILVPLFYHTATHSHPSGMGSMGRYLIVNFVSSISFAWLLSKPGLEPINNKGLRFAGRTFVVCLFLFLLYYGWKSQKFLVKQYFIGQWVS